MNVGLYQSAAALSSLERWQDVVAQNITSSQVSGFKRRTVQFNAQAMGEVAQSQKGRIGDGVASLYPHASYGVNFQQGEFTPTKNLQNATIQGEGFFVLRTPDGNRTYSRNGEFHLRPDRTLVHSDGSEILMEGDAPIQLSAQDGAMVINPDGSVFQGDKRLGKLQVVRFADTKQLFPAGDSKFVAAPGAEALPVEQPEVLQGYLEGSNISPMREMVDMVTIARAYEANQKIIQSRDGTFDKVLDALG